MGDILANTEYGKVSGVLSLDYKSTGYYSFFGIPYAKPPIGALRFKAPQHPDHWVGIRDCTKVKDGCISRHLLTAKITGSEDCLYLNVYTKNLPTQTNKPRPVLVWIHGGAFMCGSGNPDVFGPEFLITQDIVIVAMSYRVGPLGFLCLEDESLDVPGNAGIKDVLMALRWVKDNIIHFNGNPNNITVGGQSSGAVITNFLMLIPQAKGLFNKAIIQSATALQNWALGKREGAKELAKILGLNSDNEQEILTYLRQVPAVDMLKASQKVRILADDAYCDNILAFNPIIEKPHPGAVIVENPLVTILRGNYTKVPLIMGYTDEEGLYAIFVVRNKQIIVEDFEKMIPHTLKLEKGTTESKKLARKIKEFYFGDKEATNKNLPMYLKDGGVLVNNLTAVAIHEAKLLWPDSPIQCVVFIGTGRTIPTHGNSEDPNLPQANVSSWKNKFMNILDSATDTEAVRMMLGDLLPNDVYYRFNPYLTDMLSMLEIDPLKLEQLEKDAIMYLRRNEDKFHRAAKKLVEKRKTTQNVNDWINLKREMLGFNDK